MLIVALIIMVIVGTVILIGSMLITSKLMGGVEFGSLPIVVAKAIPLVLVASLVRLFIPFGWAIALGVYVAGFMFLYGLDFTEARVLIVVCSPVKMFPTVGACIEASKARRRAAL